MDVNLDAFIESTKLPEPAPWMNNVAYVFVNGIPEDCYMYCKLPTQKVKKKNGKAGDIFQREMLAEFVCNRLQMLAEREYKLWINGRMPYITPRELQLWRLRQFVQYIWFWNLPDDEDLAMIFNETKRKASNLINDFIARFRKTLLFPAALRRLYRLLLNDPKKTRIPHEKKPDMIGNVYHIVNRRYLDDCNMFIHECRMRISHHTPIADAYFYDRDSQLIWVDTTIISLLKNNDEVLQDILDAYQEPEQEHE